jgi:hypothetical protein
MSTPRVNDLTVLRSTIQKEKEELISMFLANASSGELAERFKRIDELTEMINPENIPRNIIS